MKDERPDSKIRRHIAGFLFVLGLVWAVPAFYSAGNLVSKLGPPYLVVFWVIGLTIWLAWGAVAMGWAREMTAHVIWIGSFVFHLAALVTTFLFLLATAGVTTFQATWWWAIPVWWSVAAVASAFAYAMEKSTRD